MSNLISMDAKRSEFKGGRWAPLKNVMLASRALDRALNRSANLPGFVVLYGPSGWGKSMAASFCANKYQGVYVEVRSHFRAKGFAQAILKEMGIRAGNTIGEMMEQIAEQLDLSQRPLILDEADYLIDKKLIELVRDIHEMARTAILLIGEEQFARKLKRASERFHNRVYIWQPVQPASRDDSRHLAHHYCEGIEVADDLLDHFRTRSGGVVRVICVNLDDVREHCQKNGLKKIDLEGWGKRPIYTGEAPPRERETLAKEPL